MTAVEYSPVTPEMIYAGLAGEAANEATQAKSEMWQHNPCGNSYMDLFANLARQYGKRPVSWYAKQFGVDVQWLDGAIRCMAGMSAHDWINGYLCLVACDLLEKTDHSFTEIGKILHMSSSSFTQFFQAYRNMQPYQYRNLKQQGRSRRYHFRGSGR